MAHPDLTWNLDPLGPGKPISATYTPVHILRGLLGIETEIPSAAIVALNIILLKDPEGNHIQTCVSKI